MKIKTTHTKTETKEIEITFPCFTKVTDNYSTKVYCLKSEKDIVKVEQYSNGKITNVSQWAGASDAFQDNFEVITKDEFMEYYESTIDQLYVHYSILKNGFIQDDRTEFEIEQDRKEAEEQRRVDDYCDKSNEY